MTHLFRPRTPFYKEPAFAFAIAAIFVLWALFTLTACADKDQPPTMEERLQGAWQREWAGVFTQTWSFDGHGQCLAYSIVPGQAVQFYAYQYKIEGDTLTMTNLATSPPFRDTSRAVLGFPDDSTLILDWVGGVEYHLKRI